MKYPWPLREEDSGLHAPVHHSMEVEYCKFLCALIEGYNIHNVLEIGTADGMSTWWWLQTGASVTTIDTSPTPIPLIDGRKHLTRIVGNSREVLPKLREDGEKYGLIVVDGGHSFEVAKSDIEQSLPLLRTPGTSVIAVHDTVHEPKVMQAVQEFAKGSILWAYFTRGKGLAIGFLNA